MSRVDEALARVQARLERERAEGQPPRQHQPFPDPEPARRVPRPEEALPADRPALSWRKPMRLDNGPPVQLSEDERYSVAASRQPDGTPIFLAWRTGKHERGRALLTSSPLSSAQLGRELCERDDLLSRKIK